MSHGVCSCCFGLLSGAKSFSGVELYLVMCFGCCDMMGTFITRSLLGVHSSIPDIARSAHKLCNCISSAASLSNASWKHRACCMGIATLLLVVFPRCLGFQLGSETQPAAAAPSPLQHGPCFKLALVMLRWRCICTTCVRICQYVWN